MNLGLRRLALPLLAMAAGLSLGAAAPPAPSTIGAGSLHMTGNAVNAATINGGTLRMTGAALDAKTVAAGSLRMTGDALDARTITAGSLHMTGRGGGPVPN